MNMHSDRGQTSMKQQRMQAMSYQRDHELPAVRRYIEKPLEVRIDTSVQVPWIMRAVEEAWRELRGADLTSECVGKAGIDPDKLRDLSGMMEHGVLGEAYPASYLMAMLADELHGGDPQVPSIVVVQGRLKQSESYLRGSAVPETGLAFLSMDQIRDLAGDLDLHREEIKGIVAGDSFIDPSRSVALLEDAESLEFEIAKRVLRHELGHLHGLPIISDRTMSVLNGYHCGDEDLCMMRSAKENETWIRQFHQELLRGELPCLCAHCQRSLSELMQSVKPTQT